MPYKVKSIERFNPPQEIAPGWARWRVLVDFWDTDENEKITEEVIMDRSTQTMRNLGDDNWELVSKEDTLIESLTALLDEHEPKYVQRIKQGERGNKGSVNGTRHGTKLNSDVIISSPKVQALINVKERLVKNDFTKPSG